LPGFAGLLLDLADKLIDVAIKRGHVVVGECTPFFPQLAFDLFPIALQDVLVDHDPLLLENGTGRLVERTARQIAPEILPWNGVVFARLIERFTGRVGDQGAVLFRL
jgi:hypothetical protein